MSSHAPVKGKLSQQLFKIKDLNNILQESHDPTKRLKKVLGPMDLILLGIGAIIGAGIFTVIGTAAAGDLVADKGARHVLLWTTGLAAVLALVMDLEGGLIALGVKVASHTNPL